MDQSNNSAQAVKQLKMLLVLPAIAIPLFSMAFYGLGGGKGTKKTLAGDTGGKGYNMRLPGARFDRKDEKMDKMAFYNKADLDSARIRDEMNEDPYHTRSLHPNGKAADTVKNGMKGFSVERKNAVSPIAALPKSEDTTADMILQKLGQLKKILHQQPAIFPNRGDQPESVSPVAGDGQSEQISRLARLMQNLKASDSSGADPQIDKLSGMLDKIIRIQHPDLDTGKVGSGVIGVPVEPWSIHSKKGEVGVSDLSGGAGKEDGNAQGGDQVFFSIGEGDNMDSSSSNMIKAVVQVDQTVVAGGSIMLRLTEDAVINGIDLPRDNLIYGVVSLTGERMNVYISSIRYKNGIYPVSLQVYDQDGLPGIHIPGAITRDVAKESADEGISAIGLASLDQSVSAQAAAAGIQAAKTLLSRKIKLVRVSVRAGYQVFLRNTKVSLH